MKKFLQCFLTKIQIYRARFADRRAWRQRKFEEKISEEFAEQWAAEDYQSSAQCDKFHPHADHSAAASRGRFRPLLSLGARALSPKNSRCILLPRHQRIISSLEIAMVVRPDMTHDELVGEIELGDAGRAWLFRIETRCAHAWAKNLAMESRDASELDDWFNAWATVRFLREGVQILFAPREKHPVSPKTPP